MCLKWILRNSLFLFVGNKVNIIISFVLLILFFNSKNFETVTRTEKEIGHI